MLQVRRQIRFVVISYSTSHHDIELLDTQATNSTREAKEDFEKEVRK